MKKRYHLIGIGGIGMSGIAKLLLKSGIKVSGSDLKENIATEELKKLGVDIFIGHRSSNVKGSDIVVYSSAISEDSPEIKEAKAKGLTLLKRAQALAELMQGKRVITISGSHGKTTTTSLASCLLLEAGFSPTVAIGGILKNIENNAAFGEGDFFVAEADESDGSFLYYQPQYSIITNIDREHLDYYQDFSLEVEAFRQFMEKTRKDGCVFACVDDQNLKTLLKEYKNKYVAFGLNEGADIYTKNIAINGLSSEFDVFSKNDFIARFSLALGGRHNISNALSVIALGLELGIDLAVIKNTLRDYQGTRRRLEVKFNENGVLVIDDYAHHPTEIKASLLAVKNLKPKRLIAVFQPHRYTRTKLLLEEFSSSFDLADYIIVTDIYPAGEAPLEGLSAVSVFNKIKENSPHKQISLLVKEEIIQHLLGMIKAGDLIISLGAGDITAVFNELARRLKGKDKI